MKINSLKQVLHWLFLTVGIFSVFMLVFSAFTYLDYAREGYGLRVSVSEAWLNNDELVLKLQVENPGGMDLILGPEANLTVNQISGSPFTTEVKADETTFVIISFFLTQAELEAIRASGQADFSLNLAVTVSERDAVTNLHLEVENQEVAV